MKNKIRLCKREHILEAVDCLNEALRSMRIQKKDKLIYCSAYRTVGV